MIITNPVDRSTIAKMITAVKVVDTESDEGKGDSYEDRKDNYGGYNAGGGSSNHYSSSGDRPMSLYSSNTSLA
jgi:hypothetical protein